VNTWVNEAKEQPIPSLLFSGLWYETDLCILFGDTNTGKSILAVQIADSISRGEPVPGFRFEAERQRVLYCDFELTKKQFEHRYSENYSNHYKFSPLFDRAEINPEMGLPKEFKTIEDYLMFELERIISTNGYKVLIVDNLTYLRNGTETARDALPLMKILKQLKNKYSLSILVLAHTPKRDYTKPISRNDLQGSKMLMNFCDSSFAIGESTHDKGIRYLKQIKSRFTEIMYDADNIIICQISKPDNFLGFVFTGYGSEYEHLREVSAENKEALMVQIREWKNQGLTNTEIARKVGKSEGAIRNWLKNDNKTE
jgi:archaellum biogenesis ATPase FlaH